MKPTIETHVGPYLLRTIRHDDIEAVRLLRNSAREMFMRTEEISPEAQAVWYGAYLERDNDVLVVAERAGAIVGMAGLQDVGENEVEFGRLAVAESERRMGLGFALTAKLTAWAVHHGAGTVWLWVRRDNAAALSLYEQLGFVRSSLGPVSSSPESDTMVIEMSASASEVDSWQQWDRPGVADAIQSYWYASPVEAVHRAWLRDVIQAAAPEGSVLEAGCGTGRIYEAIRDLPQVRDYVGVDTSRSMLAMAKVHHPRAHWRVGDLRQLTPDSATTVLCLDVLGHLPGDLVNELRSLISAATSTVIVAMWTAPQPENKAENVAGVHFLRNSRTHADILSAIHQADPNSRVVQHRGYGENIAYVIRKNVPPLVHSVIVGSYNRPTYVRKAIRSVMEQSYAHWQIIVTDDGSTDETMSSIRQELGNDERCQLIVADDRLPDGPRPSGNVRAVKCINRAIPLVRGDIVHYLPDDDWFLPGRFEAFNKVFLDPKVMMAYGVMKYADGEVVSETEGIYPGSDVIDPHCVLDQTQVAHRAACFEKVPLWSTEGIEYAADGVFYRDLCRAGYGPVRPFQAPVSVHRRHGLNLINMRDGATELREG